MNSEMQSEALDICATAIEKFPTNYEEAAKFIKISMDKQYGSTWHAVIGEGYGFEITHDVKSLLYFFDNGNLAFLLWKLT
jgi:dynein light chain 4